MEDLLKYEKELYTQGYELVGGIDEVGRGPLFGSVVAACVILPKNYELVGLNDSKKLSAKKREYFYDILTKEAVAIGIGIISEKIIDEINIYEATKLAMKEAINHLKIKPDYLLIDAMKLDINIPQMSIIKGDAKSLSIAAASVIAKVTRDRTMQEVALKHPLYGFDKHKGYPTKKHIEAVQKYGLIEGYRLTFKPICFLMDNSVEVEVNEKFKNK